MGGRLCMVALAALLAGCGSSAKPATQAASTTPSAITGCPKPGPGWRSLAVRAHGQALDVATLGTGSTGVVFANESGNDPCPWLPFAGLLAKRGDRVAVFSYGPGAPDAQLLAVARALHTAGAHRLVLVGASVGGRAVIQVAARNPADVAAAVSLSAERRVAALTDILPAARHVRVPSLYVGSREDGYTTFGSETRDLNRVTPARVDQMLLVPGGDHGVDLLSDENAPRVRATILAFLAANT